MGCTYLKVLDVGEKFNKFHSVIISINFTASRLLLLSVVRPCLEYSSEVWECNKSKKQKYIQLNMYRFENKIP